MDIMGDVAVKNVGGSRVARNVGGSRVVNNVRDKSKETDGDGRQHSGRGQTGYDSDDKV